MSLVSGAPAQLPRPNLGGGARAQRLSKRPIDKPHATNGIAHDLSGCGIFCDLCAESVNAACPLQTLPAPKHGLALGKPKPNGVTGVLPAPLIGVEEGAFQLSPEATRQAANRWRAQRTCILAPASEQLLEVAGRHQHIGVSHHHPLVAGRAPTLSEVIELWVGGRVVLADEQTRACVRGYWAMS